MRTLISASLGVMYARSVSLWEHVQRRCCVSVNETVFVTYHVATDHVLDKPIQILVDITTLRRRSRQTCFTDNDNQDQFWSVSFFFFFTRMSSTQSFVQQLLELR